jgi:hypothetical protein
MSAPSHEQAPPLPGALGARRQALRRDLNEEIERIEASFDVDEPLELVCECEHADCFARLTVSHEAFEAVRRFPTRFLIRREHLSADERVVEETTRYAVVEKVGPGAQTAILLDRRNDQGKARRS